jgi:trichoplein keratin filament-binding protein
VPFLVKHTLVQFSYFIIPTYFSMDAFGRQQKREIKALQLKRRRVKLADMLQNERDQLEAELHGVSKNNYLRMKDMKERTDEIRSAREEKRQALANDLLYEHFKQNNPDLRKVGFEMFCLLVDTMAYLLTLSVRTLP